MTFDCTKLGIMSSIRQAYGCLWYYKFQHILISIIAVLPFCLAGFSGVLDPLFLVSAGAENMPDDFNSAFAVFILTVFIWAIPVTVLWHRLYLLGPEHLIRKKIWPLITRSLKVISHSLIFFGLGLVAAAVIAWGVLYLRVMNNSERMAGTITEMGQIEYALYVFGIFVVLSFLLLIGLRFSMAFSSLTIGKSLRFTTSWQMTRKNTFRMLAATLGGGLPLLGVVIAVLWLANHFFQIDLLTGSAPEPNMIYIFVLVAAPILTLPMAILCSLTSTFYRHCGCADFRESNI
ncbi:hypothetical protein MNBD_ALPHA02-397 [hydrothermal vent metagenome]|uniref:Uncharacterized protein n=1 Tax=hydrothermal vent metagenome TaxID=652676 RepID=A0A3B0RTP1_9ZZZZ